MLLQLVPFVAVRFGLARKEAIQLFKKVFSVDVKLARLFLLAGVVCRLIKVNEFI